MLTGKLWFVAVVSCGSVSDARRVCEKTGCWPWQPARICITHFLSLLCTSSGKKYDHLQCTNESPRAASGVLTFLVHISSICRVTLLVRHGVLSCINIYSCSICEGAYCLIFLSREPITTRNSLYFAVQFCLRHVQMCTILNRLQGVSGYVVVRDPRNILPKKNDFLFA